MVLSSIILKLGPIIHQGMTNHLRHPLFQTVRPFSSNLFPNLDFCQLLEINGIFDPIWTHYHSKALDFIDPEPSASSRWFQDYSLKIHHPLRYGIECLLHPNYFYYGLQIAKYMVFWRL